MVNFCAAVVAAVVIVFFKQQRFSVHICVIAFLCAIALLQHGVGALASALLLLLLLLYLAEHAFIVPLG